MDNEVPICHTRAHVMIYDDTSKKWIPNGSSPGFSKVQVYQHTVNNTFRVVGLKLQDHEVVINCPILKNLRYNQATPMFHQWRDSKHVYGLNFANKEDSESFANAMQTAFKTLNDQGCGMAPPSAPGGHTPMGYQQAPAQAPHMGPSGHMMTQQNGQQQEQQQQIGEDVRTSRPDFLSHRRHPSGGAPAPYSAPQVSQQEPAPQPPHSSTITPTPPHAPQAPPGGPPAAPPAPPVPAAPPAPPCPPVGGAPPPPPCVSSEGGSAPTGLAAAIQAAKLRKTKPPEDSPVPSGPSSLSASRPPTGGPAMGGPGPMDHMNELQKKLVAIATRVNAESETTSARTVSSSPTPSQNRENLSSAPKPQSNGTKLTNGTGSSKLTGRRNPSLTGQEHIASGSAEASAISNSELEALKQEILTEIRKEMNKMKQEILEAIRDSNR